MKNFFDRAKLFFSKDKEFRSALYDIMGFYPHNIELYRIAFAHKSLEYKSKKSGNKPLNNERLEYLGDAVLETVVSDIVYHHFPNKREGFLTNTRSKIVSRESLGRLAKDLRIDRLIQSQTHSRAHNSYLGGNSFEALMGAIYLDRGFHYAFRFVEKRIIGAVLDLEGVAHKEVNFKSKLLEWSQKNRIRMEFKESNSGNNNGSAPSFQTSIIIEGLFAGDGKGFSKKESHQNASKEALTKLRREPDFLDSIFRSKEKRTAMEADEFFVLPKIDEIEAAIAKEKSNRSERPKREKPAETRNERKPKQKEQTPRGEKPAQSAQNEPKPKAEAQKPRQERSRRKSAATAPTPNPQPSEATAAPVREEAPVKEVKERVVALVEAAKQHHAASTEQETATQKPAATPRQQKKEEGEKNAAIPAPVPTATEMPAAPAEKAAPAETPVTPPSLAPTAQPTEEPSEPHAPATVVAAPEVAPAEAMEKAPETAAESVSTDEASAARKPRRQSRRQNASDFANTTLPPAEQSHRAEKAARRMREENETRAVEKARKDLYDEEVSESAASAAPQTLEVASETAVPVADSATPAAEEAASNAEQRPARKRNSRGRGQRRQRPEAQNEAPSAEEKREREARIAAAEAAAYNESE